MTPYLLTSLCVVCLLSGFVQWTWVSFSFVLSHCSFSLCFSCCSNRRPLCATVFLRCHKDEFREYETSRKRVYRQKENKQHIAEETSRHSAAVKLAYSPADLRNQWLVYQPWLVYTNIDVTTNIQAVSYLPWSRWNTHVCIFMPFAQCCMFLHMRCVDMA